VRSRTTGPRDAATPATLERPLPTAAATLAAGAPAGRHRALLETATALFLQHGLSVTMDSIAAAARMSKRTLYGFYANKMALFMGVLDWLSGEATEAALSLPPDLPLDQALRKYAWALYDHYATPNIARFLRLLQKEQERIPELDLVMRQEVVRTQILPLRDYFDSQPGETARAFDTRRVATAFARVVIGEIADGYARGGPPGRADFSAFVDGAVDLFLNGIRQRRA